MRLGKSVRLVLPLWSDFRVAGFISKKAKHMQLVEFDFREMVSVSGAEVITDSVRIAKSFGRSHHSVIRAIENLKCSVDFSRSNYAETSYTRKSPRGSGFIKTKMYTISRDGAMFLIMGFTGSTADQIKEKYIAAFNWMTKKLKVIQDEPTIELMATLRALPAIADQASFHGKGLRKSGLIKKTMIQRIDELSRQLQMQLPLIE